MAILARRDSLMGSDGKKAVPGRDWMGDVFVALMFVMYGPVFIVLLIVM
jgi:hypothetical protein